MTFDDWVRKIGIGFHPDTRPEDYWPPLSRKNRADLTRALLDEFNSGRDPYGRTVEILTEAGVIGEARWLMRGWYQGNPENKVFASLDEATEYGKTLDARGYFPLELYELRRVAFSTGAPMPDIF